jgi:cell division septation protein DedD
MYGIQVHGKASYPGLGTLRVYRTPASYTEDRKKIKPPFTFLGLDHTYDEQYNVLQLGKKLPLPVGGIQASVKKLDAFIQNETSRSPAVLALSGIGTFEKSAGFTRFTPDESVYNFNAFYGWPEIPVTPLPLLPKNLQFAVEQPKELIFPGKKNTSRPNGMMVPLILTGLVVFILLLRFLTNGDVTTSTSDKDLVKTLVIEQNEITQSEKEKHQAAQDTITPAKTIDDTVHVDAAEPTRKQQKYETTQIPTQKPEKPAQKVKKEVQGGTCTYIVGAFTKQKNALNLKSMLEKNGYTVELSVNNRFHRVGVKAHCQNDTSKQFKKLTENYPDLWILEDIR